MTAHHIALNHYLKPLNPWLLDVDVSEIMINDPRRVFIDKNGAMQEHAAPELTLSWSEGLASLIANFTSQRLSEKEPLLSAILPQGERVQIVLPPACEKGKMVFALRKQVVRHLSLEDYARQGAFEHTRTSELTTQPEEDERLKALFSEKRWCDFLTQAILAKKNIIVSGATHSGKTAFLNACLRVIPDTERLITLEDSREVVTTHPNQVNLIASKNNQGVSLVTMSQLVATSLRLRPDRIILGEIRSEEALDFVNAAKTGHDGTIASIHAQNPRIALLRLADLVQSNKASHLSRKEIMNDLSSLIDIVVQMKRSKTGAPYQISQIYSSLNQEVQYVEDHRRHQSALDS